MAHGVFGAAGYRASLGDDDQDDRHSHRLLPTPDPLPSDEDYDRGHSSDDEADFSSEDRAFDGDLEQADQMVGESGIVYGAEPIPREVTGVTQRPHRTNPINSTNRISRTNTTNRTDSAVDNDRRQNDHQQGDYRHSDSDKSDGGHSPESGSVPVGRLGGSDLYITPRLTFDLVPAQPLLSPEERHHPDENEPEPIRRLLAMYRFTRPADRAREFVRQAQAMEGYEPEGTFDSSFQAFSPVYSDMTVRQLKGYFAWRTCVRRGQYPPTSTSTVFVYIYELLNGVGVADTAEAYRKLKELKDHYADRLDAVVARYASDWLRDLVIAGNLKGDPVTEQFSKEIAADRTYAVLSRPQDYAESLIARAARSLGSYKASKSPLNHPVAVPQGSVSQESADNVRSDSVADTARLINTKNDPVTPDHGATGEEDKRIGDSSETPTLFDLALACVWKALLSSHVAAKGYFRSRVAAWKVTPVTLFRRAVYSDSDLADHPYETRRVAIDAVREYTRENGHWYLGHYEAVAGQKASMNDLLHEVDRIGRLVWHTGRPLKPRGFYPPYTQIIVKALTGLKHRLDRQEWEAAHPPVHVDLGRLTAIRQAAAGTRESLLTQEERDAEAEEARREAETARNQAEKNESEKNRAETQKHQEQQEGTQKENTGEAVRFLPAAAGARTDTEPVIGQFSQPTVTPVSSGTDVPSPEGASGRGQSQGVQPQGEESLLPTQNPEVGQNLGMGQSAGAGQSLSPDELFLLHALADGRPASAWKPTLLARHVLPSVLADSINTKLFDLVGDSVLETDENGDPVLIEDYLPDVKDFLRN